LLIDIAVSICGSMAKKEAEKILKCKDLTIEIQRVCSVETKVVPVHGRLEPSQSHSEII
jgi:hypothetical protein